MLITLQLMLTMLRTLALKMMIIRKWGAVHLTSLQLYSHNICFINWSEPQYTFFKHTASTLKALIWVSFTKHHHRATQSHSPNIIHRLQVNCNTRHFSASGIFFEIH